MSIVIKDYQDYTIDKQGNVESYRGTGRKPKRQLVSKPLKATKDNKGYLYVTLCNSDGSKKHFIHKLVAAAYIPNPDRKPQVNHIDGNKLNCKVSNLEWCTNQENQDHARATGLYDSQLKCYSFKHPRGFRVDVTGLNDFCDAHNLNASHMSAVASGKLYQHKGWMLWQ